MVDEITGQLKKKRQRTLDNTDKPLKNKRHQTINNTDKPVNEDEETCLAATVDIGAELDSAKLLNAPKLYAETTVKRKKRHRNLDHGSKGNHLASGSKPNQRELPTSRIQDNKTCY